MRNALLVFVRDFKRLLRVPKAWAIILGIIIMPSLYAWVNIVAFWDPYSNTQDVKVAVVNLDDGAHSDMTGELDLGDQVVAQLKTNHQLGWQFLDKDEAMHAVRSGSSYAAIIIPPEFSKHLLTITTGDFVRPKIHYYVNEKANAIAPKITDVGASTLETQINSTFVSTVAKTVTEDLQKAGVTLGDRLVNAKEGASSALEGAVAKVQTARDGLTDIQVSLKDAQTSLTYATGALNEVNGTIGDVQSAVTQAQGIVTDVQGKLITFTDSVTSAYVSGSAQLADASTQLNAMIAKFSAGAERVSGNVGSAIADATAIADASGKVLAQLQKLQSGMSPSDPGYQELSDAIGKLEARNQADQQLLANLGKLQGSVTDSIDAVQSSADAINATVQQTTGTAGTIRSVLTGTIPNIHEAMSQLSASASAFSAALTTQKALIGQSVSLLTALNGQLSDTVAAVDSLNGNLAGVQQGFEGLRTDLTALSSAQVWDKVRSLSGLDPQQIADFMASPVTVQAHTLFPVKTYGSAMAPLFTNLALWIAAFMLVVLLKQEADSDGIAGLTVRQAYLGRFMLLGVLNVLQALLVSIGDVVIGVQLASPVAFVATSVFVGLVYVSIIYALATSFGYVGKGIAIILVIMQIPGASGIYPIEMMPGFFQALFPFFPFTYGINAMRETIGGFYDGYYWQAVGGLLAFAALSFVLGIFVRQRLGNFARLFNRELAGTGLFVTEDVQILGSRRRLSQIVQALSDRSAFRAKTARQKEWLDTHHLTVYRLTLLVGVTASALLFIASWVIPDSKALILGLWGALCLLVIGVLGTVAYIRQSIVFAGKVGEMPESELQKALVREEAATHSSAALDDLGDGEEHRERDAVPQGEWLA